MTYKTKIEPSRPDRYSERVLVSFTCDKCGFYCGRNIPIKLKEKVFTEVDTRKITHQNYYKKHKKCEYQTS